MTWPVYPPYAPLQHRRNKILFVFPKQFLKFFIQWIHILHLELPTSATAINCWHIPAWYSTNLGIFQFGNYLHSKFIIFFLTILLVELPLY